MRGFAILLLCLAATVLTSGCVHVHRFDTDDGTATHVRAPFTDVYVEKPSDGGESHVDVDVP